MLFPSGTRFRLEVVQECGSTQDLVLAQRGNPPFHGAAVLALRQTAGHGRRGRAWDTGTGNLALSFGLALREEAPLTLLPFACGIALFAVTARFLPPNADLRLKWPNDLYLNGRKLAGMLAQGRQVPGAGAEVVVGVGLNLRSTPEGVSVPPVALAEFAPVPSPEGFAREFLAELERVFDGTRDFDALRSEWERGARLGQGSLLIVGETEPVGAVALLPSGELLVRHANGRERKLASEEVSLRLLG